MLWAEDMLHLQPKLDTLRLMIGVDLFAGAGGMSIGAEWAGVDIQLAVEIDRYAAQTYRVNHADVDVRECDIRQVTEFPRFPSDDLIVFGGPPCQGFSTSNQKTRSQTNPNNWLFREYLRIIRSLNPRWVVFENVQGILETEKGMFLDEVLQGFNDLGYSNHSFVLNARNFGVPQSRNRLFIVASRDNEEYTQPMGNLSEVTVAEAIDDLPSLLPGASLCVLPYKSIPKSQFAMNMRNIQDTVANNLVSRNNAKVIARYEYIPQGGNWEDIPKHLMDNYKNVNNCHTGIYHRLANEAVSVVIGNYRKNMLIHPTENRGLSVREAARLQSFPDSFVFQGSIGFQQQQVGNAVPPLLAQAVFRQIISR